MHRGDIYLAKDEGEKSIAPSRCRKSELLFLLPTPLESLDADIGLVRSLVNENCPIVGEGLRNRGDSILPIRLLPVLWENQGYMQIYL